MVLDNLDRVQLTLDYMEQNLKTEIQVKELSRMTGYSEAYVVFSIQQICTTYFSGKEKYEDLAEINGRMLMRLIEHKEELCFDF